MRMKLVMLGVAMWRSAIGIMIPARNLFDQCVGASRA